MEYVLKILNGSTTYRMQNSPNLYNFMYDVLKLVEDDKAKDIHILIRKNLGESVYNDWCYYCHRKNLDIEYD